MAVHFIIAHERAQVLDLSKIGPYPDDDELVVAKAIFDVDGADIVFSCTQDPDLDEAAKHAADGSGVASLTYVQRLYINHRGKGLWVVDSKSGQGAWNKETAV